MSGGVSFKGSSPTEPATKRAGDIWKISAEVEISGVNYQEGDWIVAVEEGANIVWKKINNSGLVFSFKNRLPDANGNVSPQSNDYTLEQIDRTNSKLKDISNVNYDIPNPNYNSSIPDSVEKFYAIQNGYIIKYLSSPTDAQPEGFYAVPDETGTPPTGSTNIEKNIPTRKLHRVQRMTIRPMSIKLNLLNTMVPMSRVQVKIYQVISVSISIQQAEL